MQMIEFTQPMAPHGKGDRRVVPKAVADRLVDDEKVAKRVSSPFDAAQEQKPRDRRAIIKGVKR